MNLTTTPKQKSNESSTFDVSARHQASIAVIVPVRNEEKYIARTLDQLLEQQRDRVQLEIVVVDGQSEDKTCEVVQRYAERHPEVRLLDNPERLSSAARNLGIEQSTGEYVVVVDGHCELPSRSYFVDLIQAFESSDADCLGRPQPLDVSNASRLQKAIALARSSRLGHHPDSFIYSDHEVDCPAISVAVAYRREVFEKVGLFDTRFDACEDCELNHRIDQAGMRCRLIPKLAVKYEPRTSLAGLFRQLYRYGQGRVRLFRKHADTWGIGSLIPALFVLYLLLGGVLAVAYPITAFAYAGGLTLYAAVVSVFSIAIAIRERKPSLICVLPLIFLVIHAGVGGGSLVETIVSKEVTDAC